MIEQMAVGLDNTIMTKNVKIYSPLLFFIFVCFCSYVSANEKSDIGSTAVFKARVFDGFLEMPYSFWFDNREPTSGYSVFHQDIPENGHYYGTIIIGKGDEETLRKAVSKHIFNKKYPHHSNFTYQDYKIDEYKQNENSKYKIKDKVVVVSKLGEFIIFFSIENNDEWIKYLKSPIGDP